MARRPKWTIAAVGFLVTTCTFVVLADPLGWFSKAPFEWIDTDLEGRISISISGWPDGSVEALVRPRRELAEDEFPSYGHISINDTVYKFAPRTDKNGEWTFYASLPVGAVPLNGDFVCEILIKDRTDAVIFRSGFEYESNSE